MSNRNNELFEPMIWKNFCDQLDKTGNFIIENSPSDSLNLSEGYRYLARLVNYSLGKFIETPNLAKPIIDYNSPKIGGDNPDFLYGQCAISGKLDYRISGVKNDAFNINFGSYFGGLGSDTGLQCSGNLQLKELNVSNDGKFEIFVSQNKFEGNWLTSINETNSILIRQTLLNREKDIPAEIEINIIDESQIHEDILPLDSERLTNALNLSGLFVGGVVQQFLAWTNNFMSTPNEINPTDPNLLKFANGDPDTFYHNGYFDLQPGEGLLVELEPPACEYWNIQVANHWLESLDFLNFRTHYNHANAEVDLDGKYRFIISPTNPKISNWIDTVGHNCGCIALRWNIADSNPNANTEVIKLENAEVRIAEQRAMIL